MQVIKLNGDHLTFKGRVYGSVGIEYRIEYDKTAFQVEYNCEYVYSKEDRDLAFLMASWWSSVAVRLHPSGRIYLSRMRNPLPETVM